jgi:hypothetical protein
MLTKSPAARRSRGRQRSGSPAAVTPRGPLPFESEGLLGTSLIAQMATINGAGIRPMPCPDATRPPGDRHPGGARRPCSLPRRASDHGARRRVRWGQHSGPSGRAQRGGTADRSSRRPTVPEGSGFAGLQDQSPPGSQDSRAMALRSQVPPSPRASGTEGPWDRRAPGSRNCRTIAPWSQVASSP